MARNKTYVFQNQITSSFSNQISDNINIANHAPSTLADDLNILRTQMKRTLGNGSWLDTPPLNLYSINSMLTGTLNINNLKLTGSAIVHGDLTVLGSLSAISSTNTEIKDAIVGLGFASGSIVSSVGDRGWIGGLNGSDSVAMIWDNSEAEFVVGRTSSPVDSTDIFLTEYSNFHAGNIRGSIIASDSGFSGSLTTLVDGTPYLQGAGAVSITTGSNGQITISVNNVNNANIEWNENVQGDVDGTNTNFSLAYSPSSSNTLMVFVNGVLQDYGEDSDFTLLGNIITFNIAPPMESKIKATYSK